jgi:tetratricopeptide (TPR) repeat protein
VVGRYRIPWVPGLALLAGAGAVDTARRLAARRWRDVAWSLGLLAAPAAALAWVPTAASLTPDRWALFYVKMFTAYENAGRLDDALEAMDDCRALDPRMASYFRSSLNSFIVRDQKTRLSDEVARRVAAERAHEDARTPLRVARWLRLLPDGPGREESRRLLDQALVIDPDDPRLHRELGAWWLGDWRDPASRRHAFEELDRASSGPAGDPSAAILFALISGDARQLDRPPLRRLDRNASRLRMARASLAARPRDGAP